MAGQLLPAVDYKTTKPAKNFDDVSTVEKRVNFDVRVEFFGIIKIYNPVREDLIRKAAGLEPESPSGANPDSAAIQNSSTGARKAG